MVYFSFVKHSLSTDSVHIKFMGQNLEVFLDERLFFPRLVVVQDDTKKTVTFENPPPQIEEIQEKKIIDRN